MQQYQMQTLFLALIVIFINTATSAYSDTWDVAKYQDISCIVKPSTAFDPAVTGVLVTKNTDREACQAAKGLKTDDASNANGCPSFQQVTLDKCEFLGFPLR